jgi:hypothetical protein
MAIGVLVFVAGMGLTLMVVFYGVAAWMQRVGRPRQVQLTCPQGHGALVTYVERNGGVEHLEVLSCSGGDVKACSLGCVPQVEWGLTRLRWETASKTPAHA